MLHFLVVFGCKSKFSWHTALKEERLMLPYPAVDVHSPCKLTDQNCAPTVLCIFVFCSNVVRTAEPETANPNSHGFEPTSSLYFFGLDR